MKIKTSELTGAALDWSVAKCEGVNGEAFRLYYEPTEPTDYDSQIDNMTTGLERKKAERVEPVRGNTGHGHVWSRPDGLKSKCGGPTICAVCAKDAASVATPPAAAHAAAVSEPWQPIDTAPLDRFVLLACPSGYKTTPRVFTTGIMHSDYKQGRWVDHANDDLTDWGMEPTHWMPLPPAPSGVNE